MEASATRHDRTADVVEPTVEDEVAKRPRRHFVIGNRTKTVFGNHRAPERRLVGHVGRERDRVGPLHVETCARSSATCAAIGNSRRS